MDRDVHGFGLDANSFGFDVKTQGFPIAPNSITPNLDEGHKYVTFAHEYILMIMGTIHPTMDRHLVSNW
jgi:hypothetical protein